MNMAIQTSEANEQLRTQRTSASLTVYKSGGPGERVVRVVMGKISQHHMPHGVISTMILKKIGGQFFKNIAKKSKANFLRIQQKLQDEFFENAAKNRRRFFLRIQQIQNIMTQRARRNHFSLKHFSECKKNLHSSIGVEIRSRLNKISGM